MYSVARNLSDVLWEAIRNGQVLSLYQGLGTKNLQSIIQQFVYFYGYSFLKRLYLKRNNFKSMGTTSNLIVAAAAGACTVIITQVSYSYFNFVIYLNVSYLMNLIFSSCCMFLLEFCIQYSKRFFWGGGWVGERTLKLCCVFSCSFLSDIRNMLQI